MTTRISRDTPFDGEDGPPVDLITLHEDDLLLDQLGRGEEPANSGAVAAALSEWRTRLPEAGPTDDQLLAAAMAAIRRSRPSRRWARGTTILATGVLLACGAVTAAAEHAGPDSPLWPITQLMFRDAAEARAADAAAHTIAEARASIDGGQFGLASRLLDDATSLIEQLDERSDANRLRAEIAALRALIPADTGAEVATPDVRHPSSEIPGSPTLQLTTTPKPQAPVSAPPTEPSAGSSPNPAPPNIVDIPSPPLVPGSRILPTRDLEIPAVIHRPA
jgi:hypothetical protein